MRNKWPDFLFTLAVRLICGAVLGALAGLLLCAPIGRQAARRPLLDWIFGNDAHPWRPYFWFGAWSLGGAVIALLTIPRWQTPWYRRERLDLSSWGETDAPGNELPPAGLGLRKGSIHITTVGADGEKHEYSSLDDVPPEIRRHIEACNQKATPDKGSEWSVIESSPGGDAITLQSLRQKSASVYKIVDDSGVERIYHSLEEMPPELRAAIAEAEQKPGGSQAGNQSDDAGR